MHFGSGATSHIFKKSNCKATRLKTVLKLRFYLRNLLNGPMEYHIIKYNKILRPFKTF